MNNFDVVICVGIKDSIIVKNTIKYIRINIAPNLIYLILSKKFMNWYTAEFIQKNGLVLVDEDSLCPGLTNKGINRLVNYHFLNPIRSGWYFQQFLKMGFALSQYAKDYYLIWDADTIPTSKIDFFSKDGKMFICPKSENHRPYFDTVRNLLNLEKIVDFSFIAEHMIISRKYMIELIEDIAKKGSSDDFWFKIVIDSIDPTFSQGFSEFETYGTFLSHYYSSKYSLRKLRTMRHAGKLFGNSINSIEIEAFKGVLDTISIEAGDIPPFPRSIIHYSKLVYLYFQKKVKGI